ncbi:MAG TPA: hypothetical protein VFA55_06645 [Candidatus Kapabacteria bacterium]|nr:hypothetical protein [Candidatus Kapabacteria bacterium]
MSDEIIVSGAFLAGFLFYLFDPKPHVYRSKPPFRFLTVQSNMAYAAKLCWLVGAVEFVYTRDLLTDACFLICYGIALRGARIFADYLRKRKTISAK